jgi:hypothetical protein
VAKVRNTATQRLCPQCQGEGNVEDRSPTMAPWEDGRIVECDFAGCEDGWVRFRDEDPLEQLRVARIRFRDGYPSRQYAGTRYGAIRQRAVSPVMLPPDDPIYYQAVRDADAALQTFRVFDSFLSIFGRRAA